MRKFLAKVSVGVVLMAQVISPVLAADAGQVTVNSGDNNDVHNTATEKTDVRITNDQTANVNQTANIEVVSGQNNLEDNIALGNGLGSLGLGGGVSLVTGEAVGEVNQTVRANDAVNVVDMGGSSSSALQNTTNTGDDNHFDNESKVDTKVTIKNDQDARVSQSCGAGKRRRVRRGDLIHELGFGGHRGGDCEVISGQNDVEGNIGGEIGLETGPAGLLLNQDVDVNHTVNAVVGGGHGGLLDHTGSGAVQETANTGDNNDFHNRSRTRVRTRIYNDQDLRVWQRMNLKVISGQNDVDDNIGDVLASTGPAVADGNQMVTGNDALNAVGSMFDLLPLGGSSAALQTTVNTGEYNDFDNDVQTRVRTRVRNYQDTNVWQKLYMKVISGQDDVEENIGGALLDTGPAVGGPLQEAGGNSVMNQVGSFFDVFFGGLLLGLLV